MRRPSILISINWETEVRMEQFSSHAPTAAEN